MTCKQCGQELRDSDRFCPNCGAKRQEEIRNPSREEVRVPEAEPQPEPPADQAPGGGIPRSRIFHYRTPCRGAPRLPRNRLSAARIRMPLTGISPPRNRTPWFPPPPRRMI